MTESYGFTQLNKSSDEAVEEQKSAVSEFWFGAWLSSDVQSEDFVSSWILILLTRKFTCFYILSRVKLISFPGWISIFQFSARKLQDYKTRQNFHTRKMVQNSIWFRHKFANSTLIKVREIKVLSADLWRNYMEFCIRFML